MLPPDKLKLAEQLAAQLDSQQLMWLSGYLAGLHALPRVSAQTPAPILAATQESLTATVLYGSQTGNSKTIAEQLRDTLKERGISVALFSMAEYKTARLKKEKFLFIIVSTHGEGEPPDNAIEFIEFLNSARAPQLSKLSYSVLALGDSSYEYFCQTGRDIYTRLKALGAVTLAEMAECDTDFSQEAKQWRASLVETLTQTAASSKQIPSTFSETDAPAAVFNRESPFMATVLVNISLNERQTRHIEFSLEDSNLYFRPGDSLGVWPQNSPALARQIAQILCLEWAAFITIDEVSATTAEWLSQRLELTQLTPKVLSQYAKICPSAQMPSDKARAYISGRNMVDMLSDYPLPSGDGAAALQCFRRLAPRLYSLASSLIAREDEAHILVGDASYVSVNGSMRRGLCSDYLSALPEGQQAAVFIQSNDNFRLPDDNDAPIIMIGPGTGIAPFRSFIEEREERGGDGKNWLFFGERRQREDFYYQTEWQARLRDGILTEMNVAFSRDKSRKVYVQDKMQQHARQLWEWMEDGAYIYVCGDEKNMAGDVHQQLCVIADTSGANGEQYLKNMKESGRYQRDVY